jgi:hypothetical protein
MPEVKSPNFKLAIAKKTQWPVSADGRKKAVRVVRKESGLRVMDVTINPTERTHAFDCATALALARCFVALHNNNLDYQRREQARARASRLKIINERKST